jgi:formate dehydrogenase assembly factor FdhD
VDLAAANNLTLVGFLRDQKLTVYSGDSRIQLKH